MGFYATDERAAVLEPCQENLIPPSKNRVWNFFTTSETCTGFSESQPVETHQEKWPTPTTTASGVRYYGHRYYNPGIGRWASRDPVEERGFKRAVLRRNPYYKISDNRNLFIFVQNDPILVFDPTGLTAVPSASTSPGADPCEEAEKIIKPGSKNGTMICYNGKLLGCVWSKAKKGKYPGIISCIQEHEDKHVGQHPDFKCEPCKIYAPVFPPEVSNPNECAAYKAERACLVKSQKADCGSDYDEDKDPFDMSSCEIAYWNAIRSADTMIEIKCK